MRWNFTRSSCQSQPTTHFIASRYCTGRFKPGGGGLIKEAQGDDSEEIVSSFLNLLSIESVKDVKYYAQNLTCTHNSAVTIAIHSRCPY